MSEERQRDVIDDMYDDLYEQGYLEKDRDAFRSFFFAPGEQGYKNRKALYDDLHGQGYLESPTYEDFTQRIGLHAATPQGTQQDGEGTSTTTGNDVDVHEPKYGSKSRIDDSPYGNVKEPKQVEWQTKSGDTVRVDTIRPRTAGGAGAAIVEVEKPRTQVEGDSSEDSQQRALLMSKESLDDFYSYEPPTITDKDGNTSYGQMTFGWKRGARISRLNDKGMRLMNTTGGYENEAYLKAEKEAEQMSDEQLIAAFNKLSSVIPDDNPDALAGLPEGYEDASVLRAYARELRMRDVGYEHASQMANKGEYRYMAARAGDSGVASEIDALESMSPEQRVSRLRDAYRQYNAMLGLDKQGLMQDEDYNTMQAARRTLAAATAIYAKEHNVYSEDAYQSVMNMAADSIEKQTGFGAGFKQGLEAMGEGVKHLAGEVVSLVEKSRGDYGRAQDVVEKYGEDAEEAVLAEYAKDWWKILSPLTSIDLARNTLDAANLLSAINDVFSESRGDDGHVDINKANRLMEQRMKQELGIGEGLMRSASINMSNMPQVEGAGAWIGQNVAQMIPSAAAILVGVTTKSPTLAQAIGNIGMGVMVASSAGSAMQEARQYGASDDEVWMTGISNGMLEWVTEKIPFDRYTKRVFGGVKARTTQRLLNTLQTSEGRREFNTLLKQAKKELASSTGIKAYMGDVLAEGVSEFAAGTTQKMCEMIYKNPKDYPTLYQCLQDGWDGFLAGAFMGSTMGGVSIGTTRLQADARRKQAGNVTIGFLNLEDGGAQMVEILGTDAQGNVTILRGDGAEPETVKADDIPLMHTYTYDEWHKGEMQRFADDAEDKGANLEGAERAALRRKSDSLGEAVVQWLGEEGLANAERDPVGMLEQVMNDDWSDEQKQQFQEYVESLLMYDGVIERVNEDIEAAINEANERIDAQTNADTGMIHKGKLVDGSDVYVISGNVVTDNEGNIDMSSSTPDIIVLDSDGNKKFMGIAQLSEVEAPVNPDELREESANNIRQQMGQAAADEIDGILPFNEGDQYHVVVPDDGEHDVQVLRNNDDGTVTVVYDGDAQNPQVVSKGDLQAWADEAAHEIIPPATSAQEAGTGDTGTDNSQQGIAGTEETEDEELSEIEKAHRELYSDPDMTVEDNDQFVANNIKQATEAVKKAENEDKKTINETDREKFKAERMRRRQALEQAQAELAYWQGIKDVQDGIVRAERERAAAEQAERDRIAHEKAVAEAQAEEAARLAAEEEQRQRGASAVHPSIRERWEAAPKIEGNADEIVLPNGERMTGRYVLVESGAATPSHNPNEEFAKNEGFPVDENGQTINDRDYERDKDAQSITREMGRTYDSRALQDVPVVSRDGVVLSGNGRTMAGELAARGNTDGAYIDYLRNYGGKFGFTAEQVGGMQHPRVVFVPDAQMPYNTDTFAKFNAQEKKGMSVTELAVKLGKTVPDDVFRRILQVMNEFDTLGEFYGNTNAATGVINELRNAGVIGANEYGQMFDGDTISERGKEMIESMLIGKAFEGSPDSIRQLTEYKSLRQSVVSALSEIVNNIALGGEYSLADELSAAIDLCYKARKAGIKAGKPVSGFARQRVLFQTDGEATVADYTNAAILMLADALNDNRSTWLRRVLNKYNGAASDAAAGGMDLFSGTREEKSDIIKNVLNYLNNGQEGNEGQAADATSEEVEPEAEGVQQASDAGDGVGASEQGEQVEAEPESVSETPEQETATPTADETELQEEPAATEQAVEETQPEEEPQEAESGQAGVVDETQYVNDAIEEIAQALAQQDVVRGTLSTENSADALESFFYDEVKGYITKQRLDINNPAHVAIAHAMWGDTRRSKEENKNATDAFVAGVMNRVRELVAEPDVSSVDTYKVGDVVYVENIEHVVDGVNADGTLQLRSLTPMAVHQMNASVDKVRRPGSQESIDYFYNVFAKKIRDERYSQSSTQQLLDVVDKDIDQMAPTIKSGDVTSAEAEQFARLLGMRKALTEWLDGGAASVVTPQSETASPSTPTRSEDVQGGASETSGPSRLVSDERMEELKKKLRNKLRGQANMGIDPEVIVIGTELAVGHIERGVTKFADYARAMISDIGDVIRPYLKAFYNAVRDMPEASGYVDQMDSYDVVREFDVANFDKPSVDALATAETITQEREVRKLTTSDGRPLRKATTEDLEQAPEVWHNGEPHRILILQHEGELSDNITATAPRLTKVILDDGRSVNPDELWVLAEVLERPASTTTGTASAEDVAAIKDILKNGPKKSKGKSKEKEQTSGSALGGLFAGMTDDDEQDEVRQDIAGQAASPTKEEPVTSQKPTTKQGWFDLMEDVYKKLCERYKLPTDPVVAGEHRYRFDYRATKGYRLDELEKYYEAYREKLNDEVEPATDKQLAYIERLADSDEREILKGVQLNKFSAGYVIEILKASSDAVYSNASGSVFDDYMNELKRVAEMAGKKPQTGEVRKGASELSGDSGNEQERMRQERQFVGDIAEQIIVRANNMLRGDEATNLTMTDVKRMLAPYSLLQDYSTTDLQELVELAMTRVTRLTAQRAMRGDAADQRAGFAKVVAQYLMQPSLTARDSTRIERQQYSTPTPFGYVMGQFIQAGRKVGSMLEPSAGNGALTITFDPSVVHVNDIDERRVANLRTLGFGNVTTQNALLPFEGEQVDGMATNPPFGSVSERTYDDGLFSLTSLEGQMAITGLDALKDDGRAAIIIGGNTEYRENGVMGAKDMKFFSYLYSHYNVVDVINIDGAMYSRNGTKYPVRIILIDGRRHPQGTVLTREQRVVPPVKSKARAEQVKTFDELYERVQNDILQVQQSRASGESADTSRVEAAADTTTGGAERPVGGRTDAGERGQSLPPSRENGRAGDSQPSERPSRPAERVGATRPEEQSPTRGVAVDNRGSTRSDTPVVGQQPSGENRPNERGSVSRESSNRGSSSRERLSVAIGEEKVAYPQGSAAGNFQSRVPANQAEAIASTLDEIGDVDQFVVDQLGYSGKEELFSHMAAEQIDGIALAITQMNKGKAFIIGDMTGVGKGRQAAGLIRYALHQGKVPIFFTQKAGLFSDMHRDLTDIGSGGLRPFIIGSSSDATITDADGNVVHRLPSKAEQERVFSYIMEHGTLPEEYDYVVTTYSQIQNGTMDYEAKGDGIYPVARKGKKGSSALGNAAAKNGQRKREVLSRLGSGNICILDESHTVGGDGGGAMFMQYMMQNVGGVTFLSATFAKRADNMPIYAMKTDISDCGVKPEELIQAIQQGGVTLQEIMSKQLVQSGQMIRRERDFRGVTIDWMPVSDEQGERQRAQFDEVASIFDGIRTFQDLFVKPAIEEISEELSEQGSYAGITQGTEALGVKNVPFASKMYNLVNQLLFALKVDAVADRVIWNLEHGFKPVISFTNTMEGFLSEMPKNEPMEEMPDFSLTLLRALDGVLRYTTTDMDQNSEGGMVPLSKLSPEGRAAYDSLRDRIMNLSAGLTISPMDAIRMKIEQAGYKVAEITGRQTELAQTDDGRYVVRSRSERDKKAAARGFNDGSIDVLMINKSGSTGISLHSSTKFKDQRQRVMVFAQFQSDINDEVQMRGRIDRTGQVSRGKYEYIMSTIPAEQRLQMMFKSKLKSLDANTTSSQKSKFNEMEVVDFLNKYGDEVVWDYMLEHPDLAERLGDPLKQLANRDDDEGAGDRSSRVGNEAKAGCAAKIARYLPFLPVAQQEEIFRDIVEAYQVKIQLLNDAGENDLEITAMPLRAATRSRSVWKKGLSPGSGNAFADNTYLEEVDVDILRKPMKGEEVRAYSQRLSEGKSWEDWKQEKLTAIKERILDKLNSTLNRLREQSETRAEKRRQKYIEQATKYREQGKNDMSDAQIQELADTEYRGMMDELEKKVEAHRRRAVQQYQAIVDIVDRFTPLQPLIIPTNLSDSEISLTPSFGTFVGIKFNRDYSLSASTAVFATLDGRRKVELPLTSEREFNIIEGQSRMQSYTLRELSMDNWDSKVPTSTRKRAYIVTGNLLQALVDVQGTEGVKGTLVTYTTMSGDVRQGILMSDSFEPKALKSKESIEKSADEIRKGSLVSSSDKEVEIMNYGHMGYRLSVPKSKARGEKYFSNPKLRRLVRHGEFETSGGRMVAFIDEENLDKVLRVLGRELGVTVTVDSQLKQVNGDEGVMFRDGDVTPQRASVMDETASEEEMSDAGVLFREEDNPDVLARLNSGETVTVYRAMQLIDGKLYPPMSAIKDGQLRGGSERDVWEVSEESLDTDSENFRYNEAKGCWEFLLQKNDEDDGMWVAYNPYFHTCYTMLNDQFSSAQDRDNIVVVECEIPASELTSGYKAVGAKDGVGEVAWHSGVVSPRLPESMSRQVVLSRWVRIKGIVPYSKVAQESAEMLRATRLPNLPSNVFPKELRRELEKLGFEFVETNNKGKIVSGEHAGESWTKVYGGKTTKQGRFGKPKGKRADAVRERSGRDAVRERKIYKISEGSKSRRVRDYVTGAWRTIEEDASDYRVEGMPGTYRGYEAALEAWRNYAPAGWTLSDDGMTILQAPRAVEKPMTAKERKAAAAWRDSVRKNGRAKIAELGQKLGIEFVIVDDMSNAEYYQLSKRKQRAKGWYDRSSRKMYIQLDAHGTSADIVRTILHEAVAHKGLRELFGSDFDTFLDNVYANADAGIRREISRMAVQEYGGDFRVATEEYLARLAEMTDFANPQNHTFLNTVKAFFLDMLRKVGIVIQGGISDSDLQYILWRSYNRMEERGVLGAAEDVVMREKLEASVPAANTAPETSTAAESQLSILWPSEGFAERLQEMPDSELLENITESDGWDFYSQEYDSRHQSDYNEATDHYKEQFALMNEDGVREAYAEARERWDAGGFKSAERSELRAQMDMASLRLDEIGEDREWDDDYPDGPEGGGIQAEGLHYDDVMLASDTNGQLYREWDDYLDGDASVDEIDDYVKNITTDYGIGNARPTYTIRNKEDLESLREEIGDDVVDALAKRYDKEGYFGAYDPLTGNVYVFTGKMWSRSRAAKNWWHEQGHGAYDAISLADKYECGRAALDWLLENKHVDERDIAHYKEKDLGTEGAAYLLAWMTDEYGVDGFLNANFTGSEKITTLARELQNYFRNGRTEENSDRLRQSTEVGESLPERGDSSAGDTLSGLYPNAGGPQVSERGESRGLNDDYASDALFRDGDFTERDRVVARDAYERMVSSGAYQFQEAVQDSMLGLKRLMQSVLGKDTHMEDVAGYENAYLAENRMSSENAAEQHEYYVRYMKPLLEVIGKMCGRDANAREVLTDYMMAKHGLERNKVLAERDARETEKAGGDYQDAYNKNREKDYAGLTALTGEDDVTAAEAAAQQMVDDYERDHDVTALWSAVNAANAATLAKVYQSGLLTQERYDAIRKMFEYYIPLQGWDETTSDEVYAYLAGHDRGMGGNVIKRAEGRRSKADDPIATMAMQADAAIRQGNRNIMKRCFLNFVQNHPSDAVSMNHLWLKHDDVTDEWVPVFADINESDSAAEVARKVAAFEARMAQLASQDPDNYKSGRDARDIPYKVVKGNLSEHQILVKRNGISYVLTINGNPRASQALNGLTNPDVDMGGVVGNMLKAGEWVNRNLSAFYTTRNPDFVVSNFFRDMLYSNCMAWVKERPNYALRFHWNFGKVNPLYLRYLVGRWENGTLDRSKYMQNMFYQFMMNGGETGYTSVKDIEGHKRTIARELRRQGSLTRRAWHAIWDQLDLLNRSVENCARFAAFLTSQELGRSMERSIWDAKEVSVNFNKKGSGGKMVNATGQTALGKVGSYVGGGGRLAYVFWNAGVQGSTNFMRAFKRHPVKATVGAASMFLLGILAPLLAKWMSGSGDGDDDDDRNEYYNLPEYIRRSNFLIWAGGKWVAIPLPIEFRAIYGLGELATGVITRNERYSDSELAFQMGSQVSQVLPLDMLEGGGGVNPFIPSSVKPLVEAYWLNESWSGLPIYRDTPFNKRDPEWTKAYSSANTYLVSASKWLNEFGGGDDYKKADIDMMDINPAKVEYLLSGTLGGAVTTVDKLVKMGETAFGDREFDWRNMLIANRVIKSGDERTAERKVKNEYFKYKDDYEETKHLLKKYKDAADSGVLGYAEKLDFLNHSKEFGRYQIFDAYNGLLEAYRESGDAAGQNEVMREMVELLHDYDDDKAVNAEQAIDTRLRQSMMSADGTVSKKAASELAKRAGGKDGYGSSKKEYNAIYTDMRNDVDLDEDVKLQVAEQDAVKAGDKQRASEIHKARLEVTKARKELETADDREGALEHMRRVRRGAIERLGL